MVKSKRGKKIDMSTLKTYAIYTLFCAGLLFVSVYIAFLFFKSSTQNYINTSLEQISDNTEAQVSDYLNRKLWETTPYSNAGYENGINIGQSRTWESIIQYVDQNEMLQLPDGRVLYLNIEKENVDENQE